MATDLQDLQHFIRLLLRNDGVVVEAAELPLQPKGVDVARVQILLLGTHQLTRGHKLEEKNPIKMLFSCEKAGA